MVIGDHDVRDADWVESFQNNSIGVADKDNKGHRCISYLFERVERRERFRDELPSEEPVRQNEYQIVDEPLIFQKILRQKPREENRNMRLFLDCFYIYFNFHYIPIHTFSTTLGKV